MKKIQQQEQKNGEPKEKPVEERDISCCSGQPVNQKKQASRSGEFSPPAPGWNEHPG